MGLPWQFLSDRSWDHRTRKSSRKTAKNRSVAVRGLPRCHGAAAVRGPTHVSLARRVDPLAGDTLAWTYPLVNVYITMERSTIFNGKTHYKWPFSIAMLNYQRVKTHVSQSFINVYDVQTNRCAHHKNLGIYLFSCLGTHHDKHESSIWSIKARRDIGTTLTPTIILM